MVAAESAKPTVTMTLQPWSTRFVRLGAKSVSASDCTLIGSTPSSLAAFSRPSDPSWLNDLSSNPPESETMQGTKSEAAAPPDDSPPSSGAEAQPASRSAALSAASPPMAALRVVIVKMTSKIAGPQGWMGRDVQSRYRIFPCSKEQKGCARE